MQNRVLLVEDDDELRELLARYLTNQGFTVREAANGRDGLALALGQDCDIVVLDIMLPGIDGLELCKQLRGSSSVPIIRPMVVTTGMRALRSACLSSTGPAGRPLARAVRM